MSGDGSGPGQQGHRGVKGAETRRVSVLVDGFFHVPLEVQPQRRGGVGVQEIGLPYAADPAVSKHLAVFLSRNLEVLQTKATGRRKKKTSQPAAILFNGGVFKAEPLRDRMLEIMNEWNKSGVKALAGTDLDTAVAAGGAYYGLVRRGKGIRIRGGTARAYYVGIESSLPAVPGSPPPLKALCVVPFGMEEGTENDVPGQEFGLVVGEQVDFRFLGSTTRRNDTVGTMVEEWSNDIEELTPLRQARIARQGRPHGPSAPAQQGDGDRHAGAVVHQPG